MNRQQKHKRNIVQFIPRAPSALYDIGVGWKSEWRTLHEVWPEMKVFGCEPNSASRASCIDNATLAVTAIGIGKPTFASGYIKLEGEIKAPLIGTEKGDICVVGTCPP